MGGTPGWFLSENLLRRDGGTSQGMIHKILRKTNVCLPEIGLGTWNHDEGVDPLKRGIALGACLIVTVQLCVSLREPISPRLRYPSRW